MAACRLAMLNVGSQHTCVRRNERSIVDVTFASPLAACRVSEWRVRDDIETLSDYGWT